MTVHLANTPVLETERLILRAPIASDFEVCSGFMQSQRAEFVGGPYTAESAWRAMGHIIGHWVMRSWGLFVFADRDTGRPMGTVGPYFPEGWAERELGWTVWSPSDEGKGYVSEAARRARVFAFETLGWDTAVSYINPANARSIAVAERLGCVLDTDAPLPDMDGWAGTLVYRHPNTNTVQTGGQS